MTRAANSLVWGLALLVGALVLGKKDEDPLPWAIAAVGVIVTLAAFAVVADERMKS